MAKNPKPEPDDKEQSQRFVETAKALGVDESGKAFQSSLKKIVRDENVPTEATHKNASD